MLRYAASAEQHIAAPPAGQSTGSPVRSRPIVIVKSTLPITIRATGFIEAALADRGAAQLLIRQVELIGVEILIVAQHAPWQRAIFLADTEEAAEGHHGIGDLAAAFIDHDAFDRADPVAIATADRGAFDLVAGDQMRGLAHHDVGSNSGHCKPPCFDRLLDKHLPAPPCSLSYRDQNEGKSLFFKARYK